MEFFSALYLEESENQISLPRRFMYCYVIYFGLEELSVSIYICIYGYFGAEVCEYGYLEPLGPLGLLPRLSSPP